MVRISKEPEERRKEILDTATEFFRKKGYEQTAISDIAGKIHVAQGTIYYYFETKEDIFVAILDGMIDNNIRQLEDVLNDSRLKAIEKINIVIQREFNFNRQYDDLFAHLHLKQNAAIHQRFIVSTINKLVPLYAKIIEQGIEEKVFDTKYPKQTAEYLLVATKFLFDPGIFSYDADEWRTKLKASQVISERALGAAEGSLIPPDLSEVEKKLKDEGR